jgi:hypothetical protein
MGKWCERIPMVFGMWGCVLTTAWGASSFQSEVAAAIQAIEQAPDPSATVAAYVNGAAVDRNDPKLSEAYVVRMVDLGLPELAFHQAQTLTTLESNNGLAWGVIAYVEARRGNMPEAISAINLAGQFAPDNLLVQRTAGEIIAWYDVKADKATLSENAKQGLETIRGLLGKRPEFANAYKTAKEAYKAPASAPEQPAQSQGQSTSLQTASPTELVSSYPDYYYASGPGWVEPTPWWWWQPIGFFAGFDFFPFTTVVVFNHRNFFRDHDRFFHGENDRFFDRDRNGRFFNGGEFGARHNDGDRGRFFGMSATTNPSMAASSRDSFHKASVQTARSRSTGGSVGLTAPRMSGRFVTRQRNTIVQRNFTVGPSMGARSTLSSRRQMAIGSGRQFSSTPQVGSRGRSFGTAPRFAMSRMSASHVSAGGGRHGGGFRGGHR